MSKIRFKGFQTGANLGAVSATVGSATSSVSVPSFLKPSRQSTRPTVLDAFDDGTLTPDDNGIPVTTRIWRIVGGAVQGNGATLSAAGLGGQWVEYSPDNGVTWSPPVMVYATAMMGMAMPAGHLADDAAIIALVPHADATHIAVADGNWTDAATWLDGAVPQNGATVLIPRGLSVTYDVNARFRFDRIRVDGTLAWALDQSTYMLVETMVGTRGSSILMGTPGNRLPAQYTAQILISGKDYSSDSYMPTDLKSDSFLNTLGWARGIIAQGTWRIWGAEMSTWKFCEQVTAGSTSLDLLEAPIGWNVGDEICIGGTRLNGYTVKQPLMNFIEDDYVTITAIDGTSVTFTPALIYDHINHNTRSDRTDLYPVVFKRGGKNISIESEVKDINARRGHTACVHHHCVMDFWDAEFIGMGRTEKNVEAFVGVIDENGDFRRTRDTAATPVIEPLSNTANLASRYPIHAHHCGFNRGADTARVNNCYVEDVPGWAIVHHACAAKLDNNVMHLFGGAGMVSESGNEIDSWVGNLAITTTGGEDVSYGSTPKNTGRRRLMQGDFGWEGFGFVFRGRVMRTNRNVAVGCGWGHVYHHRTNSASDAIAVPINPKREHLDFDQVLLGNYRNTSAPWFTDFSFVDAPITHNADNVAIACVGGLFVTKSNPRQGHDINIHFKDFLSWGYYSVGFNVEYVSAYLLEDLDCVSSRAGSGAGIVIATNAFQIGIKNARTEGNGIGIALGGGDALVPQVTDNFNNTTDPRYYVIGHRSYEDSTPIDYIGFPAGSLTKSGPDVTLVDPNWDNAGYDRFANVQDTHPQQVGTLTSGSAWAVDPKNADGAKIDTLSADSQYPIKPHNDSAFNVTTGTYFTMLLREGYYTLNSEGGNPVSYVYAWVSDRVSARPTLVTKYADHSYSMAPYNNLGVFNFTSTPVTLGNDKLENALAVDNSIVVDVLTDAVPSGGDGTFALADIAKVAPDHGSVSLNTGTGEITYTPDLGYSGTDFMYVFIESAGQFATVRLDFLIGSSGAGLTSPQATTDFAVADGGSQSIDITTLAPPDTDKRRIRAVEYSTDSGATWRGLSTKWVKGTQNVTVQSDGTAIVAGSYSVRIRYKTDYDFITSAPSSDAAVSVA